VPAGDEGAHHPALGHLDAAAAALNVARRATPDDPALEAAHVHVGAARAALVKDLSGCDGRGLRARSDDHPPRLVAALELVDDPSTALRARTFVAEVCGSWRLPAPVIGVSTDIANELVCNALVHGSGTRRLTLELAPEHLTVRVFDESPDPPRQRAYLPGVSVRGLGLRLVDQLAASWGHVPWERGKYVWALVKIGSARPARERRTDGG
jgi:hypothetical protein